MKLKSVATILSLTAILFACSDQEHPFITTAELENTDNSARSQEINILKYPMYSFIDTISLEESDISVIDGYLNIMQTTLGNGYI